MQDNVVIPVRDVDLLDIQPLERALSEGATALSTPVVKPLATVGLHRNTAIVK